MRIIGGKFRGVRLAEVGHGDVAAHLRPTTDRVRENMFNLLQNGRQGDWVRDARVLDLFAGTGALGLEALSRGATQVVFVDNGAAARALIKKNVSLCRAEDVSEVLRRDATDLGPASHEAFNLIFLDPPYGQNLGASSLIGAAANRWIAEGAGIVWEERAEQVAPPGFQMLDIRHYGNSCVHLLKFSAFGTEHGKTIAS